MENAEISIEANPDDLTKGKIKELSENFGFGTREAAAMHAAIFDSSKAMGLTSDQGAKLFGTFQ